MYRPPVFFCAAAFATLLTAASSTATGETGSDGFAREPQRQIEIFLSSIFADSATEGSFGLRGAFRLKNRWHLEGGLSRLNGRIDIFLVDLTAKYYLRDGERTDVFLLAGPGLFYSSDLDAEELMLHAGIGAEFSIRRQFYLRPELRGRWFTDNIDDLNIGDLSLGFGWRF